MSVKALKPDHETVQQWTQKVDGVRARILGATRQKDATKAAPVDKATALQRLDGILGTMAQRGGFDTRSLIANVDYAPPVIFDLDAFLIKHLMSTIRQNLMDELDAIYEAETGLTEAERAAALDRLDDAISDARAEEADLFASAFESDSDAIRRAAGSYQFPQYR